ncbi:MAG: hypothetical protein ROZ64_09025 [Burkholderiaceae bacterium]|nr:hypothetical protein [Burkholderiaceae bacterium]
MRRRTPCPSESLPRRWQAERGGLAQLLKPGVADDVTLRAAIERSIVQGLGTPFRPSRILVVGDLPRTRNMKVMRRVIRAVCAGEAPGDLSALLNPEAVSELRVRVARPPPHQPEE